MKKILLMALSMVTVAALAITGTIAWLTWEDSDVNVMTTGNVQIKQHEYERVVDADGNYETITVTKADGSTQESYKLQEFTQGKPLYPAVGDPNGGYDPTYVRFEQLGDPNKVNGGQQFFAGLKNAQDKIVLVENTGTTDAYVRTIFAFEMGKLTNIDEWHTVIMDCTGNIGEPWSYKYTGVINIDGNNFAVMEAIYTGYSYGNMRHNGGILPAGDWTYNSLAEVYMTSNADNTDVEAIDGNKNGTYDILVLSQGVQVAGFDDAQTALDTAFGKSAEKAADWFGGVWEEYQDSLVPKGDDDSVTYEIPEGAVTVSNTDELKTALNNKDAVILLKDGEYDWKGTGHTGTSQTVSIYGESKNVILYHTFEGEENTDYDFDGYTVNFYGLTISGEKNGASYPGWARMSATYNDCVIKQTYGLYAGTHEFNYCTLDVTGDQYNIWTWGAENATFNRCTFNSDGKALLLYGQANTKLTVNSCVFNDNGGLTDLKAAIEIGNDYGNSYELIVNDTVVNGYEINDKGINTGTTLWGNKNSMGTDKLNVVVDGVDVY